jgi:hypothetical protein
LSAVATLLQVGNLTTELKRALLTLNSKISWVH